LDFGLAGSDSRRAIVARRRGTRFALVAGLLGIGGKVECPGLNQQHSNAGQTVNVNLGTTQSRFGILAQLGV